MLTIRAEQMRIFEDAGLQPAIEAMMYQHFPRHCAQLGPRECAKTIEEATLRGRTLGFDTAQLSAYVALEFAFGTDFSTTPAYPWAQAILHDRSLPSDLRMQRLRTKAIFYLAKLADAAAGVPAEIGA